MKLIIQTDGAADPNPGPASIGAVIKDESGKVVSRISRYIGEATNNQAEYRAIIAALEGARDLGADCVELHSDSELIVRQLGGQYRVKSASIADLYFRVNRLRESFAEFRLKHMPGVENEAHVLAQAALKRASGRGQGS